MAKLKIGVVGTGSLGRHHVRILNSLDTVELVLICDTNRKTVRTIAKEYEVPYTSSFEDLLGKVDAVTIAISNSV